MLLADILKIPIARLRTDQIGLVGRFKIDGYQDVVEELIEFEFSPDGSSSSNYQLGRQALSAKLWEALLIKASYDNESAVMVLTIAESTDANFRWSTFEDIARLDEELAMPYLASHVFSDQKIYTYSHGNAPTYLGWYAARALATMYEQIPIDATLEIGQLSMQYEQMGIVKDWLQLQYPETNFATELSR